MSVTDDLLANAHRYGAAFDKGHLPMPPPARGGRRLHGRPAEYYGLLGLAEGDAHVIRNAGGVVTDDEVRSLAISQRLLGTREIVLVHHTDCGMLTFNDDDVQSPDRGRHGPATAVRARGLPRPCQGRQAVAGSDRGQPVHPPQGPGARLRLLGDRRVTHRGHLTPWVDGDEVEADRVPPLTDGDVPRWWRRLGPAGPRRHPHAFPPGTDAAAGVGALR